MKYQIKKQNLGLTKIWIISIIVVLLIIIGGGIYLLSEAPTSVKESGINEQGSPTTGDGEIEQTEESNEFIVDCGDTALATSEEEKEAIINCIEENFKECKPAKLTITMDLGPLGGETAYYYEIIGSIDSLCQMKSKFLKNINPDWVGKEMICQYDNKKTFETAVFGEIDLQNMKCEGPLYELMITVLIEAKKGEKFTAIALDRPEEGSGYEWKMNYDSSYVQFVGEPEGIQSTTHILYEFLALKIGKTKIKFSLQSESNEIIKEVITEVTIK